MNKLLAIPALFFILVLNAPQVVLGRPEPPPPPPLLLPPRRLIPWTGWQALC